LNGRRTSIVEIYDNAAYPSFSFEASCPKKHDFRRKNRKAKYQQPNGLYPFVHLIEAQGMVYPEAKGFVGALQRELAREAEKRARLREHMHSTVRRSSPASQLTIDDFRSNPKYNGDGNRIDLAYAIYALSHNIAEDDIRAAIAGRDLTKKGSERRQQDYISRTLEKAHSVATASELRSEPTRPGERRASVRDGPSR
jgi:hypothetical protein